MTDPYADGFRKVAELRELESGRPAVFRAAGATLVLCRTKESVEAIDGSCLAEGKDDRGAERVQRILDCVAASTGSAASDWNKLVKEAGLPVRVEGGSVWVCVDLCQR